MQEVAAFTKWAGQPALLKKTDPASSSSSNSESTDDTLISPLRKHAPSTQPRPPPSPNHLDRFKRAAPREILIDAQRFPLAFINDGNNNNNNLEYSSNPEVISMVLIETKGELSIRHYDFSDQATVSRVDRKRVFSGKGVEAAQSQEIVSRQGGRRQQDYTGEE
ncbi:hypothetical protein JHK82_024736 [Glycine max]|nr:hypothetical protein JHK82_024736 [Glycine max]